MAYRKSRIADGAGFGVSRVDNSLHLREMLDAIGDLLPASLPKKRDCV